MNSVNSIPQTNYYSGGVQSSPGVQPTPSVEKETSDPVKEFMNKQSEKEVVTAERFTTNEDRKQQMVVKKKDSEETDDQEKKKKDLLNDKEGLQNVAHALEKYVNTVHGTSIRFSVHEDSGRIVARVIDKETHEVIKEVPPQEILDMAAKMERIVKGVLFDERA